MNGQIPWNRGLTVKDDPRIVQPWLGKKRSKEDIEKFRSSHLIQKGPFLCQGCGKTIYLKPFQMRGRKYCSHECAFKAMKNRIVQHCQYCEKEYEVKSCLVGTSKYCSLICGNKAKAGLKKERAKVILVCEGCGRNFRVKKSEVTARHPKYCSPKCFQENRLSPEVIAKISKSVNQYYEKHPESKERLREYRLKQVIPSKDTYIEVALQNELDRRGITYEKHLSVLGICQPDIVFSTLKIAVFADGDYWHTKDFYVIAKDQFQNEFLRANGWYVFRFWEREIKESVGRCVNQIENCIKNRN